MQKRVGILGMGHVGRNVKDLLREQVDVITYDPQFDSVYPVKDFSTCSAVVVCVDTPASEGGGCDITNVIEAVERIPIQNILLRSTVPPGTTDDLIQRTGKSICFSPEYVGESKYYNSYWPDGDRDVPFLILGGEILARRFFIDLLMPILGPTKMYFQCSAREAEIIKYMENAYLAIKTVFVAEFANICSAFAADWHAVREGWLLDPRIDRAHTAVFAGAPGFGGKCLPKDLLAIVHSSQVMGYEPRLLVEVLASNDRLKDQNRSL